jgi:TP901 family phage tail tape measure protein
MSTNERLGIEVHLDMSPLQKGLSDLSRALQSINSLSMSSLTSAFSNLASQLQKVQSDTSKAFSGISQSMNTTQQALQQTTASLNQTNNALSSTTNSLSLSMGSIAKRVVEFYAIRGAITAITGQISSSVKDILGLDQAVHDIGAIANASSDSMTKFKGSILDIATASKMTLPEVEKLQNLLAQSGIDAKDVPQTSKVVAAFATGTGSDPEQAVRSFTTAMNVWDIDATKSARIANTFTAGLNASKLEVNDLSTVFNYLASTAKQVGMSLEETTGTIAALSQAGLKASTIGTSLTQLLSKLMAPNDKLKKFLVDQGDIKNLDEVNPRLHTFADIIGRLQQANLPVEGILASFGDRAGRTMNASLTLGADYFRMMQANVTGTGAAFTAYSESMDGAVAKINVLRQEATRAMQVISDDLSGILNTGYDSALTFVHGLETGGGRIALAVEAVTLAVGGLSIAFQALKKWNPEIQAISLAMAGVTPRLVIASSSLRSCSVSVTRYRGDMVTSKDGMHQCVIHRP